MSMSVRIVKTMKEFTLDVNWEMKDELLVLFGRSGSGKSLTLQSIAGLVRPDRGRIEFDGALLFDSERGVDLPPQERAIGYVCQDAALFPHMSVRENIAYGMRKGGGRKEIAAKVDEMLETFHMADTGSKLPREISGGQKQRAAFARAFIGSPRLLLLDEPFSALDVELREEMRGFLLEIRRRYKTPVVLVTHDISEAWAVADRMVVYANGSVALQGTTCEVMHGSGPGGLSGLLYPRFLVQTAAVD